MRILLIAGGAREHAIADALARSSSQPQIISICKNANPGIKQLSDEFYEADILDFKRVIDIAKIAKPDIAFIGPDDPIGMGLADELETIGIPSVAPKKSLARVESSKGFARELMAKYEIDALPQFAIFTGDHLKDKTKLERTLRDFMTEELQGEYVVKYDALKGGKGVKLSGEHLQFVDDGIAYAIECIEECGRVVIEEKLIGVEFSLLSFVSGTQVVDMPAVQDHKRAYEGDTGPNTGGMGTYSDANHSLPFLTEADLKRAKQINREMAAALLKECGEPYKGILYGGFIAVREGVRVIEYNARFGDPEVLNILPLLTSDFTHICQGIVEGKLTEPLVQFEHKATVCKYITPQSYPEGKAEKGKEVMFPAELPVNAKLFFGDVSETDDGKYLLGTSRTAGIVGIGDTIEEAEQIAESVCMQVEGPVRHRKDIGSASLVSSRTSMFASLRR